MLRDIQLAPGFPMRALAEYSRGKSGSDLKELCRNAAMFPVRELVRKANGDFARLAQGQKEVRLRFTWLVLSGDTYRAGLRSSSSYGRGLYRSRSCPNSC